MSNITALSLSRMQLNGNSISFFSYENRPRKGMEEKSVNFGPHPAYAPPKLTNRTKISSFLNFVQNDPFSPMVIEGGELNESLNTTKRGLNNG